MTMAPTDEKPSHSEKIEGHGFHRLLHRFRKPKSPQNAMVAKTASNVESKESPALLPTVDPESNSKERESLRNISFDLWSDAYDRLRDDHETKDVVQKYEQILTREFNGSSESIAHDSPNMFLSTDRHIRFELMKSGVQEALKRAQKHSKAEGAAEIAIKLVDFAKDKVGDLLDAYPPASLAWSGFCIITPVLLNPILENKAMHEGLEHVIDRLKWSMALTKILLKENWKNEDDFRNLRVILEEKVVDLYCDYLEYEIRSVCACYNPWISGFRNLMRWDGWKEKLDDLISREEAIKERSAQYNTEQIVSSLQKAVDHLGTLSKDLNAMRHVQETQQDDRKQRWRNQIIGRFNPLNSSPYRDRMLINPERKQDTCEWFLRHRSFEEWLCAEGSQLLLLSAGPGFGKSVLSRYLVETELPTKFPHSPVTYFFFKNTPDQNAICKALCAILHQLLIHSPYIADSIATDVEQAGDSFVDSFQILGQLFEKACESELSGHICCVLDALDECDSSGLAELIRWISLYLKESTDGKQKSFRQPKAYIKFIVTTRGLPSVLEKFENFSTSYTHVAAEESENLSNIRKDIDAVMTDRFQNLVATKRLNDETQKMLWNALTKAAGEQRTYIWVKLMFEALEGNRRTTKKDLEHLIRNPPRNVSEAYELLLNRVESRDYARVKSMIHIIYSAKRPFTLKEMNVALHFREDEDVYSEEEIDKMSDDTFRDWVIESCGFFVTVYNREIFFIHETAREFLTASGTDNLVKLHIDFVSCSDDDQERKEFEGSVTISIAHATMAEVCILYLNMDIFRGQEIQNYIQVIQSKNRLFVNAVLTERYILLDYVLSHWENHFLLSQVSKREGDELQIFDIRPQYHKKYFELSNIHSPLFSTIEELGLLCSTDMAMSRKERNFMRSEVFSKQGFLFGAEVGHVRLFYDHFGDTKRTMIDQLYSLDSPRQTTMLGWAAMNGYLEMARHLLHLGASTKIKNSTGHTALHDAAGWRRSPQVARLLVSHGSDVDAKAEFGWETPLHIAFFCCEVETVQILIEMHARLDIQNTEGNTPLFNFFLGCGEEHDYLLQAIVKSTPSIVNKPQTKTGDTLLHLAANFRRTRISMFLLRRGADLYLRNEHGANSFHRACRSGSIDLVQVYLDWLLLHLHNPLNRHESKDSTENTRPHGLLDTQDNEENSPLHFASNKRIIRLLLSAGAELEVKNKAGKTPFEAMIPLHMRVLRESIEEGIREYDRWQEVSKTFLEAGAHWQTAFEDLFRRYPDLVDKEASALDMETRTGYADWRMKLDMPS